MTSLHREFNDRFLTDDRVQTLRTLLADMKGSAALHILSLLMASDGDGWQQQQQVPESSSHYAPRLGLDLCDPLDVESLDLNQGLYVDGDVQDGVESWVESVIELTSSGEFVSSGDQASVPSSSSVSSGQHFLATQPAAHYDCSSHGGLHTLLASDNATFDSVQNFASGENISMDFSLLVPAMSDAEEASVSALTLTPSGLEDETPRVLLDDTEVMGAEHFPSSLWNFDLSAATFEPLGSIDGGQEVAGTSTSTSRRLTSWAGSTDGDMSRLSLLSSSASSLAQSVCCLVTVP